MTLPRNTPKAILDVLEKYRHGTITQDEARAKIARLAEGDTEVSVFVRDHLGWLEHDDSVEW